LDAAGDPLERAEELLSDTVVNDVLTGRGSVCVGDMTGDRRYASVPSVVSLSLQSVLCVPMAAGERVLGAVFLGKRDLAAPFSAQNARELAVLASMAVPFLAQLRRSAVRPGVEATLIGDSPAMLEVRRLVERIAPSTLSVLIVGETGTGKEVTARAIHAASDRAARPLIALNCSAVAPSLLEAEIFGYCKGAFTGAASDREGRIEAANGSALFLDEVGDMPMPMQAALLRVLQEREVVRVGENQPRPVDFRLIAATNRDLDADVAAGTFREDLLFRLREVTIDLPPLRERGDDVVLLARLFLHQAERELSLPAHTVALSAEALLAAHTWPGNVRELRALMRRAAVLCDGTEVTAADLAIPRARGAPADSLAEPGPAAPISESPLGDLERPLADARDEFVARYVAAVLERCDGDRTRAAEALGISVRSLYRYL
jgi:DNA-binding NtrC family response regulator